MGGIDMTAHPCPDCRCWTPDDEKPAQPATSSEWARRQALEAAAVAVRRSKEARTTVNRPHDEEADHA